MSLHDRDIASLRLLCRYRLLLYPPWSRTIYGAPGQPVGTAAAALERNGYLTRFIRALPGAGTYVLPTEKTVKLIGGVPLDRAKPMGPPAIDQAISILWFCTMEDVSRHRLEPAELDGMFTATKLHANIPHVASHETGQGGVFRVITTSDARHTKKKITTELSKIARSPELQSWLDDGCYGLALLAPTSEAVRAVQRQIEHGRFGRDVPLLVGLGPTAATISRAIKSRKRK